MDSYERLSDAALLDATEGEPAAFAAFYRRYEQPILGYLRRRAPDAETAADLAAEVFASALGSARRFDPNRAGEAGAAGWLFAIARNTLNTSLRRGRVEDRARRRAGMREPLVLDDDAIQRVEEAASDPFDAGELLRILPRHEREAVLARVVDERDYDDIASELRCSALVVRKRVSRGLKTLRTHLEETR
jgi:RNA polymerase sigma-70 factor (ECF subfamily)